jgi:hypothetical protein
MDIGYSLSTVMIGLDDLSPPADRTSLSAGSWPETISARLDGLP